MDDKILRIREVKGQLSLLRYPLAGDASEFVERCLSSRDLHRDFAHPPSDSEAYHEYRRKNRSAANECFLIITNDTAAIAGAINLSQIVLGGFRSAYMGYYLFEGFTGRGLMTDAINTLLNYVFVDGGLHRVEANIQPHNLASVALVRRCGFTREGYSRNYLKIGGFWRDHERWAILREDFEAGGRR